MRSSRKRLSVLALGVVPFMAFFFLRILHDPALGVADKLFSSDADAVLSIVQDAELNESKLNEMNILEVRDVILGKGCRLKSVREISGERTGSGSFRNLNITYEVSGMIRHIVFPVILSRRGETYLSETFVSSLLFSSAGLGQPSSSRLQVTKALAETSEAKCSSLLSLGVARIVISPDKPALSCDEYVAWTKSRLVSLESSLKNK
jgi:hypothetical protein